jgi:hypothetical protein
LNDTGGFQDAAATAFVEQTCLPYLRESQNDDGGWGFHAGSGSRAEPTSWALLALYEFSPTGEVDKAALRAIRFFEDSQLANGSWPAAAGQTDGSWVTALACWALLAEQKESQSLARGMHWLREDRPGDSGLWWRLLRRLTANRRVSAQSDSYYGWSWTPGTASWVEPTSYALIVLRSVPATTLPSETRSRLKVAEEMLYDRMCPGGGWNCGNPMVYGVAGVPQVGPTVWALLALRECSPRPEIEKSLEWLKKNCDSIGSPASYALTDIALRTFGRRIPASVVSLRQLREQNDVPWSIPEMAWASLSMSSEQRWLHLVSPSERH